MHVVFAAEVPLGYLRTYPELRKYVNRCVIVKRQPSGEVTVQSVDPAKLK